jgi:hypothetical protein
MYREWKKTEFLNSIIYEFGTQEDCEADQEIDGKMKRGRMEEYLVGTSGRKMYITDRNARSS